MKKIIKRRIRISTRTRDFIDFINHEFYSHDKHNAFFEFTMEQLPTENIIGLFYFQKTKRYLEKRATVEGNTFTIEFDTSLINTDETVIGFIYFEKVVESADVHQFSFGVKVSEIDKMQDVPIQEESTKRIVSLANIVTKEELQELFKTLEKNSGTHNDTELRDRIFALENRPATGGGNQTQDTGWIIIMDESTTGNVVEIRRIGNTVHVRFRNNYQTYFVFDSNQTFISVEQQLPVGFGSVKNNLPIFSSTNDEETGRVVFSLNNNRVYIEMLLKMESSSRTYVYMNECSYVTDSPYTFGSQE